MKKYTMDQIRMISKYSSFSEASKHMYLSPQALLRITNSFEKELGFRIFNRSYQGISLTDAGEKFIEGLERIEKDYEQLKKDCLVLSQNNNELRLPFINGSSPLFMEGMVIPSFKEVCPDVTIQFIPCKAENMYSLLESGHLDLIHFSESTVNKKLFRFIPLNPLRVFCILSKTHPLAKNKVLNFEDLKGERIYVLSIYMYQIQQESFRKHDIQLIETDISYKKICLEHGIYLSTTKKIDMPSSLISIPLDASLPDTIGIVTRKTTSAYVDSYVELAKKILKE